LGHERGVRGEGDRSNGGEDGFGGEFRGVVCGAAKGRQRRSDGGIAPRFDDLFDRQKGFYLTLDLGEYEQAGTVDRAAEFRDRLDFRWGDGCDLVNGVDDEAHRPGGSGGRIDEADDDAGAAVGFGHEAPFHAAVDEGNDGAAEVDHAAHVVGQRGHGSDVLETDDLGGGADAEAVESVGDQAR
jgi:hypothetical protein